MYSFYCFSSICVYLLISCVVCAAASGTYPSTCSEAGHHDGRLTLYWKQDPAKPWKAVCKEGKEYLILNAELNWSFHHKPQPVTPPSKQADISPTQTQADPAATPPASSPPTPASSSPFTPIDPSIIVAAAHFSAIRIHPATGVVDPADHAYAQYTGEAAEATIVMNNDDKNDAEIDDRSTIQGLSAIASKLLWGSTGLCDTTLVGSFEVSVTGTPFTFSADTHFVHSVHDKPLTLAQMDKRHAQARGRIDDCSIAALSNQEGAVHKPVLTYSGPQPICGDNKINEDEECDPPNSECCSPTCRFLSASTICRAPIGPCDAAEKCSGSHAKCPMDIKAVRGVTCRRAHHDCDTGAVCDGFNVSCPPRKPMPLRWPCRPSLNSCDITEKCDGVTFECPPDVRHPDGHPCDDKNENTLNDSCVNGQCVGILAGGSAELELEP